MSESESEKKDACIDSPEKPTGISPMQTVSKSDGRRSSTDKVDRSGRRKSTEKSFKSPQRKSGESLESSMEEPVLKTEKKLANLR